MSTGTTWAQKGASGTWPPDQVRTVWIALAAVLLSLTFLFGAYAWRTHDFTTKRGLTLSQSRAELTRSQMLNAFRHMDDILLQTKSVFERMGSGIANQTGMLTQNLTPVGLAPYSCIGLVNAMGDSFFRLPEGCALPDVAAKAGAFQDLGGGRSGLFTGAFEGAAGLEVVRAVRLYYADETFAGMAVAVLNADYVFSVFKGLDESGYQVSFGVGGQPAVRRVGHSNAPGSAEAWTVAKTVLEFDGFAGPLRLEVESSASQSALMDDWFEALLWPFLGYLLVSAGLLHGARLLTRALRQQMTSDLLAQRARVESEVQNRFIANISHEVRTPMNGVLGASRLLGRTSLNENQRQILGLVDRSGKALLAIINDLLDIGKLREGQMSLERQPIDLIYLLEDSCALQAPQAFEKGLDLIMTLDLPDGLDAIGDALRVQQVVTNLLNNAVKFTETGTVSLHASLRVTATGRQVQLQVSDTGIGIDMAESSWLFQPFQQADTSTARRFGGTGLGLAITDHLVRLMGGSLEVQSQVGVGTTFSACWPLVMNDAEKPPSPEQPLNSPEVTCEIALATSDDGRRQRAALVCNLQHLGVSVLPLDKLAGPAAPAGQAVLTDEDCMAHERLRRLAPGTRVLILSREPALFRVPPHLQHAQCVIISKPARRAELLHGLSCPARDLMPAAEGQRDQTSVVTASMPDSAAFSTPRSALEASSGPLSGLYLLVAEDHAVNQILIRHMLEAAGARVQLVANGLAAVDALFSGHAANHGRFDLVLMDCQMPEMDGFSATAQIRRAENLGAGERRVPIIAMTALAMPEDKQRCLSSGMDDYCSKPIDENALIEKIVLWTGHRPN